MSNETQDLEAQLKACKEENERLNLLINGTGILKLREENVNLKDALQEYINLLAKAQAKIEKLISK